MVAQHLSEAADNEFRWADIRCQAIERGRVMNVKHALNAWDLRRVDPIAPYAVAYLFIAESARRPGRYELCAATRIWLHGPETETLPLLLSDVARVAAQVREQQGPFDIAAVLANRRDARPVNARTDVGLHFVGVAVSSLDTHTGTWDQVCRRPDGPEEIPGRVFISLSDRSLIVCERRARKDLNAFQIVSNHSLYVAPGAARFVYQPTAARDLRGDEANTAIVGTLEPLTETLLQVDNEYLSSGATRGGTR